MLTGPEIALIVRVSELARRFGLRPSDVDPAIGSIPERVDGDLVGEKFFIRFDDCTRAGDFRASRKFDKMMEVLGIDPTNAYLDCDSMAALEDAVEAAFARAPQPRLR